MTLAQVDEILAGVFESAEDRKYWEDKRDALQAKAERIRENDKFFEEYKKYDR